MALVAKASEDLRRVQERTGISKTDIVNRALTLYEFIDRRLAEGSDISRAARVPASSNSSGSCRAYGGNRDHHQYASPGLSIAQSGLPARSAHRAADSLRPCYIPDGELLQMQLRSGLPVYRTVPGPPDAVRYQPTRLETSRRRHVSHVEAPRHQGFQ